MKRYLLLLLVIAVSFSARAQSDVISVKEAIELFQKNNAEATKKLLTARGYIYKGVSADSYGKDHNWVKNMDLTKDFLPTAFKQGTSSLLMIAENGKTLYIYVFNRTAFEGIKAQAKKMGYDMGKSVKSDSGTLICVKDNQPTLTFMELQKPLPYCIQITE